jgi:chromosome segregation ATPase
MSKNVKDASLANLKHYEGKWQSGSTRTIRVPIALADATLEYARQLDKSIKSLDTSDLADEVKRLKDEVEAELAEIAQLKKQVKKDAAEVYREGNSIKAERMRWQQELSDARAELEDAKATILNQSNKIRELERGYSFKPSPKESALRLEIGDLQAELSELKQKSVSARELPEAPDLLNKLKAKRKKATASLADVEAILEILES